MFLQMKAPAFFSFSISKTVLSLLIAAFLCITLCAGNAVKGCAETEKQALLRLKNGFIDPSNILSSWNDEVDCCKWNGISCNNLTSHVTGLDLSSSGFGGKIDSSLCELQHLMFLNLSDNYELEVQKIPKCIGSLSQLRELRLSWMPLVGTIPHELGNLSNLQTLELGHDDNLHVDGLEWISYLPTLKYLDLTSVNLSRAVDWPSLISKFSSMSELYFRDCRLPHVNSNTLSLVNTSTSLKVLDLGVNNLNSSILPWVLNVSKVLTQLDLSDNFFEGFIPDGFGTMTSLEILAISSNQFEGGIPKSFRNLHQLKQLFFSSNRLSGKLSDSIKQLSHVQSSIEVLDFSHNPFSCGSLPQSIGHFSHLEVLILSHNNLSGPLPDFTNFSSLLYLDLSNNQLNGTVPCSLGQLSSLIRLELNSNNLSGKINEVHLWNVSTLQILDLSHNLLSFNLSSNWIPPFQLRRLSLSSCKLGPDFPMWLKILLPNGILDISSSGISNSIPTWFWELSPCVRYLNLSHNNIFGPLPKSSQKKTLNCFSSPMQDLKFVWDLSFNNLSGPLPQFPTNLVTLQLSNNMLSSSLSSLCATPKLQYLDLSNNLLSGEIPDCFGYDLQNLRVLNLAKNNLFGRVPKAISTLQQIESIHLNDNHLSGEIPALIHCHKLKTIDLGGNNLQGQLSSWVGYHHTDLIVLRLKANRFQGSIPMSLCYLPNLQILDLSNNNITGPIPQCFNNINALSNSQSSRSTISYNVTKGYIYESLDFDVQEQYLSVNDEESLVLKGQDRVYERNLGYMVAIDLSCNHLEGEIPHTMTELLALISLNLSRNNLTGFIPNSIGEMKMLESLDLSRNHLFGIMPASFSKLTLLSYLDLSFNNLSGQIPVATQLQTFDASSYIGNEGLCGPPLLEKCLGDGSSPTPSLVNDNEGEDNFIVFGFYVSIALGFITGFWAICGSLVIKSSWRMAYFQFASNMWDWIYVRFVLFITRMKRKFQN